MSDSWTQDRLTIGNVSKMHGITTKMLRYWDQIGLLKPLIVSEENGYRYYSSSQFYQLNFIKYMKELGVSYREIKKQLNETEMSDMAVLLENHVRQIDERIVRLKEIKATFSYHLSSIREAMVMKDTDVVRIEPHGARHIITVDRDIFSRTDFEKGIRRLERVIEGRPTLLLPSIGLLMTAKNLMAGHANSFHALFVPSEGRKAKKRHIKEIPAGDYAVLRFWGTLQSSQPHYLKLSEYIKKNRLIPWGNVIRRCLAPGFQEAKNGILVEVAVQVKPAAS